MAVRAKFRVGKITWVETKQYVKDEKGAYIRNEDGSWKERDGVKVAHIDMWAVVEGSGDPNSENARFFAATPSGHLNLQTVNEEAANQFEENKEYYLDFTPAGE